MHRRDLLVSATAGAAATLAGCLGDGGGGGDDDTAFVPTEPDYRGWFDGVGTYHGTVDRRSEASVRVDVGTRGSSGFYKFRPPAVAVSPGTEVTWRWTGRGGTHNVREVTGAFDSGKPVGDGGYTFSWVAEQPGIFRYVCDPHRSYGMKGAVFVALGEHGT